MDPTAMDCSDENVKRISPLRGLNHGDIVEQTKVVRNGLTSLRDDHFSILQRIRNESADKLNDNNDASSTNNKNELLEERLMNVTKSLEQLEVGIEESNVLLDLSDHFIHLESDRATLRLEIDRVQDENDWLREVLGETQAKLQEAMLELTDLREEKKKWDFEEELKNVSAESSVRPITPSKIPVGSWRVEEEKDINRALNGGGRSASPAPSRIPVGGWRSKLSVYKSVMDKESEKQAAQSLANNNDSKKQYFNLNAPARSRSKIPSR